MSVVMTYDITFTDEEISKSLMTELEGLSDAQWAMLGNSDNSDR